MLIPIGFTEERFQLHSSTMCSTYRDRNCPYMKLLKIDSMVYLRCNGDAMVHDSHLLVSKLVCFPSPLIQIY